MKGAACQTICSCGSAVTAIQKVMDDHPAFGLRYGVCQHLIVLKVEGIVVCAGFDLLEDARLNEECSHLCGSLLVTMMIADVEHSVHGDT